MNVLSDLIQRNSVSKHKQWDTETIELVQRGTSKRVELASMSKKNVMSVTKF